MEREYIRKKKKRINTNPIEHRACELRVRIRYLFSFNNYKGDYIPTMSAGITHASNSSGVK